MTNNKDCDDSEQSINPGATEICGDGMDQDCNGIDITCSGFNSTSRSVVAIDTDGKILRTRDGETWINDSGGDGTQKRFNSIIFGADKYVGVGTAINGFTSMWATSLDGDTWDNETTDANYQSMWDISFGNGWYITGGYHYLIRSSDDFGESWTEISVGGSVSSSMADASIELFDSGDLVITCISGSVKDESYQPLEDALIVFAEMDLGNIEYTDNTIEMLPPLSMRANNLAQAPITWD